MKLCFGVVLLGCFLMVCGSVTIYKNEGRLFLSGCLVAALGLLLSILVRVQL